jgi:uncharacterized membrane protein YphA (DoxX/SURF4 family)
MRITSVGHAVIAAMMIALGVLCLIERDLAPVWGFPDGSPALLPYTCAIVSLATGIGLLVPRVAALAARVLLVYLVLWLLLVRGHDLVVAPGSFGAWDGFAELAVIIAAVWVVYVSLATEWDREHVRFASGEAGVRIAHVLYGLPQVAFGMAHFLYIDRTIAFVPRYMPAPTFWAYFTGVAFIAAGAAIVTGVLARLAATLVAIQIGLFTILAWIPILTSGPDVSLWNEFGMSVALTIAAGVVAASYRGRPWFAVRT